ncbi:hypothetical protein [Nocardia fluminea]|uniref:hypothetical protein n=1 Tax=Nocardia fluminea TaxID=134984 RepID=UPI003D0A6980
MTTDLDTIWRITYRDNSTADFTARSEEAAVAASHARHPDDQVVSARQLTIADLLARHDENWCDGPVLRPAFGFKDGWLVLNFTAGLTPEGVVDAEGVANFRYLRESWGGLASVCAEGGRISMEIYGVAPASAFDILDNYIGFGGPIHRPTYEAVLVELGITESRTVRVAYHSASLGCWHVSVCPATLLDYHAALRTLFPDLGADQDVIVVDAVAGYPAGCSTWAQHCGEALDIARAGHLGCQHQMFRPAY